MDMTKIEAKATTKANNPPINSLKQRTKNWSKELTQSLSKYTSTWNKDRGFVFGREKYSSWSSLILKIKSISNWIHGRGWYVYTKCDLHCTPSEVKTYGIIGFNVRNKMN